MTNLTTPSQAWAILNRHARDDIASLRLKELCTDNDRVSSLVAVHNGSDTAAKRINNSSSKTGHEQHMQQISNGGGNSGGGGAGGGSRLLIADLSRQRMTLETLNHLLRLAVAVDMRGFIKTLAWGQNNRNEPVSAVGSNGSGSGTTKNGDNDTGGGVHGERDNRHFHFSDRDDHGHLSSYGGAHAHAHTGAKYSPTRSVTLSPTRSIASTSTLKKTRFANVQNSNNGMGISASGSPSNDDDQILSSASLSFPPLNTSPSNANVNSNSNNVPQLSTCPSMHMALRAPSQCNLQMLTSNGENALDEVHAQWKRIELISDSIRRGQMRGASGQLLQNILVIGRGSALSACKFVYHALENDAQGNAGLRFGILDRGRGSSGSSAKSSRRSMRFLSRVDPVALHAALSDWNPEQTIVISVILNDDESESVGGDLIHLTNVVKKWLYIGIDKSHATNNPKRRNNVWGKHVLFVTGSEMLYHGTKAEAITKPESSFLLPPYARTEAFTSLSAAGILPLSIAFGWGVVQEIQNGAHDLDSHFVESNPRHNLPVLLALVDIWNDHFLPSACKIKPCGGRMISPFMDSFSSYPAFVATIESQLCGRVASGTGYGSGNSTGGGSGLGRGRQTSNSVAPSGIVIDGGLWGSHDRVCYQGGRTPPLELITAMNSQVPTLLDGGNNSISDYAKLLFGTDSETDDLCNQDHLMCSFFAHADLMALGSHNARIRDGRSVASGYGMSPLPAASFDSSFPSIASENDVAEGNHPSTLILCSRCDAFACGQLIALAEHRAVVTARLWDIENPFAFSQSHGSSLRSKQEEMMKETLDSVYQRLDLVGHLDEDGETDGIDSSNGPKLNLAVKTLLGHYATNMYQQRKRYMR